MREAAATGDDEEVTAERPDGAQLGEQVVAAAQRLAAEVLAPGAVAAERDGVPRSTIDAMGAAGLLAVNGPPELGGVAPAAARRVGETLAGASPDAWFVWTQHHMPLGLVAAQDGPLRDRLLPALCSGTALGGVAFSHLRRPRPGVTARRVHGGWSVDGSVPWLTSWGLADVVALGALSEDGADVVFGMVPLGADAPAGLVPTEPLRLASMQGTRTVGLRLDDVRVDDDEVVLRMPVEQWRAADAVRAANVVPATFGIAFAALAGLEAAGGAPGAGPAAGLARDLREQLEHVRARAYVLVDEVPPDEQVEQRVALRARALHLTLQATAAAVAVQGGKGMGADHPAQLLARAALFMLVQAQTPPLREATLRSLGR